MAALLRMLISPLVTSPVIENSPCFFTKTVGLEKNLSIIPVDIYNISIQDLVNVKLYKFEL